MAKKLNEAKLALSYAKATGNAKLARRMKARVNAIIANIAWGE